MRFNLFLISLALSSVACTPAEDFDDEIGIDVSEQEPFASAIAEARSDGARAVVISDDVMELDFSYPAEVGQIPRLAAFFDGRINVMRHGLAANAQQDQISAQDNGYPFRPHSLMVEWSVAADLPRWLSLSATRSSYAGGAHPNSTFDGLVWDKEEEVIMLPADMFRSAAALDNAYGGMFCPMLNVEREKRRGEPVDAASEDPFAPCPSVMELTLVLESSNGRTFDQIRLLAAPYVVGPYAEGAYEFTLPVTGAVLDAVHPEFADSFSIMAPS